MSKYIIFYKNKSSFASMLLIDVALTELPEFEGVSCGSCMTSACFWLGWTGYLRKVVPSMQSPALIKTLRLIDVNFLD